MRKWRKRLTKISVLGLILASAGALSASAAVTEGKQGETVVGDYAVIVNTSTTEAQSTGKLIFDASGNGASAVHTSLPAADPAGQDVQAGALYFAARIASAGSYGIGTEKSILSPYNGTRTYVCIGESEHSYIWMEKSLKSAYDAAGKTDSIAGDMAQTYEGQPYEMLNEMAEGSLPWGKLSIMLETISNASGVYKYNSELAAIHINTPEAASYEYGSMGSRNGLLVHEGQHALFRLMAKSDSTQSYTWLNEGISVAAMDYLWGGTDNNGWMDSIAGNTDIRNGSPLFYKSYRNSTAQDYGMPYLFVRYLIAQATGGYKPMRLFPYFYKVGADCSPDTYLEKVLSQAGHGVGFGDLLTQFYTAVIAQESSGVYGFAGDSIVRQKVNDYPLYMGTSGQEHSLAPTAAIAIRLENGSFTVPSDGGRNIRYMIISGGRNIPVPSDGDGSSEHPYGISSLNDLALIGNKPDAHYELTQDIEADGQRNLTVTYFSGVLDGGGHTIHGLAMPLIGRNTGTIRNLTVEAAFSGEFTGTQGIFAQVNTGLIKDCTVTGTVNEKILRGQSSFSYAAFGAFAGENEVAGRILRCETRAEITLTAPAGTCWVGGLAGVQTGTMKNCVSRGSIVVTQPDDDGIVYVGGLAGKLESMGMGGLLSCCIHIGSIRVTGGKSSVGQLCGLADRSVMNTGLSTHVVNCRARAGGIPAVGATNAENAELPEDIEEKSLLTDEQLRQQASYDGWNFESDWKMGEDGPERFGSSDITELGVAYAQKECYVGEQLSYLGSLVVNGKIGADITSDMISGFDSSTAGRKTVKVSYLGKTTSFEVNVKTPGSITSFEISKSVLNKLKTTYSVGQYFDPTGLYFIATIDGNASRLIYSGYEYNRRPLTESDKSVTVSYFGASIEIPITVTGKKPMSLTVAARPSKTLYGAGQNLDLSGLHVSVTYNNGEVSPLLAVGEFESYGIRVVKKTGSTYTAIAANQALTSADDGATIYVCATEAMPNSSGAVAKSVATLTVKPKLQIENPILHVVRGVQINSSSIFVSGGSGEYTVQKISENLPSGITVQWWISGFLYDGTATSPVGSYESQYRITDMQTGQSITAKITVQVHASDYAELYMFNIPAAWNKDAGLAEDIIGVIDNDKNTVVLRIPVGTDVSALKINVDYGAGIGVTVPTGFTAMSTHDFRQAVLYELTAPDKMTKRKYTVTVEFYDPEEESTGGGSGSMGDGSSEKPDDSGNESSGGGGSEKPGDSGNESSGGGGSEKPGDSGNESSGGGSSEKPGGSGSAGSGSEKPGGSGSESSGGGSAEKPGGSGSESIGGSSSEKPGGSGNESAGSGSEKPGGSGNESAGGGSEKPGGSGNESAGSGSEKPGGNGSTGDVGSGSESIGGSSSEKPDSSGSTGGDSGSTNSEGGETADGSTEKPNNGGSGEGENPNDSIEKPGGSQDSARYPAVGTKIKRNGIYYRITASSPTACTAELYRPAKKKKSTVRMAATIKTGGYTYKVTAIASGAFRNNRHLKKITLGKNIISIGNQAFYGCRKLKTVTIPAAVKTIGNQAFCKCTSLTKAVIGKSVQTIGAKAFYGCKKLKLITLKGTALKKAGSGAVKGIHAKAVIRAPRKKRAAYKKLFKRKIS